MHKLNEPSSARKIIGAIFFLVSLINLTANLSWLRTGDIHKSQFHFTMRGGWEGFWFTTVLAGFLGAAGLYLLLTKEREVASKNKTLLSAEERGSLKRQYRISIAAFCGFLIVFLPAVALFNYFFMILVLFIYFGYIIFMFTRVRCPNCGYRLAYHNQLFILPTTCPKCGIAFK